jgi:5-methylcytosine-specific restriction endonuclease McrA
MKERTKTGAVWIYPEDAFKNFVACSKTYKEVLLKMGLSNDGNYHRALIERANRLNLDISHLSSRGLYKHKKNLISQEEAIKKYFIQDGSKWRTAIRRYIIRYNLLPYECSECSLKNSWNKKPLTLQIDHKNGKNRDHRLENLTWLCPNCHSQTETYSGKNSRKPPKIKIKRKLLGVKDECSCGNTKTRQSPNCRDCCNKKREKIIWPNKEDLFKLVWSMPTIELALKMGVSDSVIKARCENLGIQKPSRSYWRKRENRRGSV